MFTLDENNQKTSENIVSTSGSILAGKRFIGGDDYANKWYVYDYDLRGSVTAILGPDGSYTKGYQYDEFGNTEGDGDNNFYNELQFTGSVSDTSSGLYYMNARYYNPKTGRFLTQDTVGGDNWTDNLYSYCGNNPVSFIDPTGYSMKESGYGLYDDGTDNKTVTKPTGKKPPSTDKFVQPKPGEPKRGEINGQMGWYDRYGNVWHWDEKEGHWDVQHALGNGDYRRITDDGRLLSGGKGPLPRGLGGKFFTSLPPQLPSWIINKPHADFGPNVLTTQWTDDGVVVTYKNNKSLPEDATFWEVYSMECQPDTYTVTIPKDKINWVYTPNDSGMKIGTVIPFPYITVQPPTVMSEPINAPKIPDFAFAFP